MPRAVSSLVSLLIVACAGEEGAQSSTMPLDSSSIVLDRRADGAVIFGRLRPPPLDADPDRVTILDGSMAEHGLANLPVIDARFAGDAILVLGTDHVLRIGDRVLDTEVQPPLSVSANYVAYARGEAPELEIGRADFVTGEARLITQSMFPAWSPALSADGREVVFVSGVEGSPRLYRCDATNHITALPRSLRTPSSPIAPEWRGNQLIFRDESGEARVDLTTGAVR